MLQHTLIRYRQPFTTWTALTTVMFLFSVYTLSVVRSYSANDVKKEEDSRSDNHATVEQRPSRSGTVIKYFIGTQDDDPELVEYVKNRILIPPSSKPYNLLLPKVEDGSQLGQAKELDNILYNVTNGFFVEAGAHDGESLSNTLYFERFRNWTGLLIEANADLFKFLQTKNRKAYTVHSCLSPTKIADLHGFSSGYFNGHLAAEGEFADQRSQCVPLYTLMLALGRSHIDLFSLDIEGDELKVLKTIPWDKLQIRLLLVEFAYIEDGKDVLIQYMTSVGYKLVKELDFDFIFSKQDFLGELSI